jgi:CBS domain-containing protein
VAPGRSLASTAVGEMCTEETATVSPPDSVAEAVRVMRRHAVRRLPVVEAGSPVGVVSIGDLVLRPDAVPASELRSALVDIMAAPG